MIGYYAGRYITGGVTEQTLTNLSIFIGDNTKALANNQTNQIVIGSSATGLGSNTTVLGNASTVTTAIYGDLLLGTTTTSATKLTVSGSETASSAIARGGLINTTLVASANNDVLVGLDINPTFTNGAFTGLTNSGIRVQGGSSNIAPSIYIKQTSNTSPTWFAVRNTDNNTGAGAISADLGISGGSNQFFNGTSQGDVVFKAYSANNTSKFFIGATSSTTAQIVLFPLTGNTGINTTTDAGFRLDVNGTARVQSTLTVGTNSIINTEQAIISNGTKQQLRLYNSGSASGTQAQLTFTTNTSGPVSSAIAAVSLDNLGNQTLSFASSNAGTVAERLRIWNTGNVTIQNGGTYTDSGFRLDVNGTGRFSGNVNITLETSGDINYLALNDSAWAVNDRKSISWYQGAVKLTSIDAFCESSGNIGLRFSTYSSGFIQDVFRIASTGAASFSGTVITGGTSINASAQLQVDSTVRGFLPPRLTTTQKLAIGTPAAGLMVYDTTLNQMSYYNGTLWINF